MLQKYAKMSEVVGGSGGVVVRVFLKEGSVTMGGRTADPDMTSVVCACLSFVPARTESIEGGVQVGAIVVGAEQQTHHHRHHECVHQDVVAMVHVPRLTTTTTLRRQTAQCVATHLSQQRADSSGFGDVLVRR